MRLLVTGGAGYIGSVVTHRLVAAGHRVEVLDDLSTGHADALPPGVPLHRRDVRDIGRVLVPGFDGVLHLAARTAASESVARPELYWDTNVRGSLAVLDAVHADIVSDAWDAYLSAVSSSAPSESVTSPSTTRWAGSGIPGQRSSGSGEE
jgi:UDP-glucose 4-epimerase